ncbi:peptidoglycan DD-metalloendopeptidase family protein [Aureibacter tunicatorum]|uniref:Murein DD-endopeptidase MepM/ murein hydrolase activator NlpD n=1 Tax=Aureibacter tunicatorum TaxID=866807 RepID=A0AAE4BRU6_9BACT|nr:peptidoglycan DD-metalloendopeptidase family protein [Aureibacter tunicatorum]MDR6237612.1 murein DD-endopeptidase MepM/ murein hydrolase activator NlpD [Aureibacter tunicatorum]BDD02647.1 peptidase M24 [Aureibacter tunicatorum]
MKLKPILFVLLIAIAGILITFFKEEIFKEQKVQVAHEVKEALPILPKKEPKKAFGINIDSLEVFEANIEPNQNLSKILAKHNVGYGKIHELAMASKDVYDVRKLASSKKYTLLKSGTDSLAKVEYFIYEQNPVDYVVYYLGDSINIYKGQKPVQIKTATLSGIITSSMYQSIMDRGASPALVNLLSDIYAWQIDFFHIQKGDKFKIIYEEKYVNGERVGLGKLIAASFSHYGQEYYAYHFDQGGDVNYFDEDGNSLRKAFLKAPLNYTRISSRYSGRRFHPVQKRFKAHLGTDYAAPKGTPIMSVGDGIVVAAHYSKYNGNFVKVKHNSVYSTQYLHMSKIKSGIKVGKKVKQGEVIGFVGKTGLATGNHLCFRFWQNGKQVDPFRVVIPPSEPIADNLRNEFEQVRNVLSSQLDKIPYKLFTEVPEGQSILDVKCYKPLEFTNL